MYRYLVLVFVLGLSSAAYADSSIAWRDAEMARDLAMQMAQEKADKRRQADARGELNERESYRCPPPHGAMREDFLGRAPCRLSEEPAQPPQGSRSSQG